MSSRLSVILYIFVCFVAGIILVVFPWLPHGWLWGTIADWGNNYFLLLAAHKAGYGLQRFVASGWVRGAVTGIGLLNIALGVREIINFRNTVTAMDAEPSAAYLRTSTAPVGANEAGSVKTDPLSDYPRRNR